MERLIQATRNSWAGLKTCWHTEAAFRQELLLCALLLPVALLLGDNAVERVLLVAPLFLLLAVELLNTGIEAAIDRIGPEIHPLSKQAKDAGSAAVAVCLAGGVLTWLLLLW